MTACQNSNVVRDAALDVWSYVPPIDHLRDTIRLSKQLAEEEGFEPPELALGGFQDRCLRPLGHSSEGARRWTAV